MIDQFVSDIPFEDCWYAVIIHSPVQSGRLVAMRAPELPEGYALYTAQDIPGSGTIPVFQQNLPVFAALEVAHAGQALAVLTGSDLAVLHELQGQVDICIEPEPPKKMGLHADCFFQYPIIAEETHREGDVESLFETAQSIVCSSFTVSPYAMSRIEPLSVVAMVDQQVLHVYVPTQWPFHVRSSVAAAIGLTENEVVVHPTQMGEVFNELLWYPSLLACQCAVAAWQSGKPVRLTFSLEESRQCFPRTPEASVYYKSAFSESHTLSALSVFIVVKAGAFSPLLESTLQQMTAAALGIYTVKNYCITAVGLKTPQGLTAVTENWGSGLVANALEHHINTVIQEKNLSPAQWRFDNCYKHYQSFFTEPLEQILTESDFHRKYAAYRLLNMARKDVHDGRWRGIGLSTGFKYNGYYGDFTYSLEMCLETDNKLYIIAEPTDRSLKKRIQRLITDTLEFPAENIIFVGFTTFDMHPSGPAVAQIAGCIFQGLARQCIADLQEQLFRSPLPLHIFRSYRTGRPLHISQKKIQPFISKAPITCVVELELDPFCYEVRILGIWFMCLTGRLYTKKHAMNVLHKSLTAALSRTITLVKVHDGDSSTDTFTTQYRENVVLSHKIAKTAIHIMEKDWLMTNTPDLGYMNLFSAAYLAALNQILLTVSKKIEVLPIHAEDIFQAMTRNVDYENSLSTE
ncbi:MAG: molybdopterin cofactor-binding domain-containing protein [Treponema sp.]